MLEKNKTNEKRRERRDREIKREREGDWRVTADHSVIEFAGEERENAKFVTERNTADGYMAAFRNVDGFY